MLMDRPEEQQTLFREIMLKKMTVREAEKISRTIAFERRRKFDVNPHLEELEEKLTEKLGTRVLIEAKQVGGKVHIDYFSVQDVEKLLTLISKSQSPNFSTQIEHETKEILAAKDEPEIQSPVEKSEIAPPPEEKELKAPLEEPELVPPKEVAEVTAATEEPELMTAKETVEVATAPEESEIETRDPSPEIETTEEDELPASSIDDRSKEEQEEDLYSVSSFTV